MTVTHARFEALCAALRLHHGRERSDIVGGMARSGVLRLHLRPSVTAADVALVREGADALRWILRVPPAERGALGPLTTAEEVGEAFLPLIRCAEDLANREWTPAGLLP